MYDDHSRGISYTAGFFLLIAFAGVGLVLGAIAIALILAMSAVTAPATSADVLSSLDVNTLRLSQIISTFLAFFLPSIVVSLMINRRPWRVLGYNGKFNFKQVLLTLVIMFCALLIAGSLAQINEKIPLPGSLEKIARGLEKSYMSGVESIAVMNNFGEYIIALVMIALLPAIFEETFFRGGLQHFLQRSGTPAWVAILIVSVLFSLIHFSFYGFLPRLGLGIVLGLLFYFSGSIWISVIGHFFNNAIAVTQLYSMKKAGKSMDEIMNESYPVWWGLLATVVIVALFFIFRKISVKNDDYDNTLNRRRTFGDTVSSIPGN